MAEALAELTALKLRAAKAGGDKITIINHTQGDRHSCSVADGIKVLAQLVERGKGQHVVHIVDAKAERERKLKNPTNATKRLINCHNPETYRELNAAIEPFYEEAIDPRIAVDLIIRALAIPRETIRGWLREGSENGPEAANVPEWDPTDLPPFLRD